MPDWPAHLPGAPRLLMSGGPDGEDIRRRRRRGEVLRVRRGAYREADDVDPVAARDAERLARARIAAVAAQLRSDFVLSHVSAALVWGCAVWPPPAVTHVTHPVRPNAAGSRDLVRHHVDLPASHVTVVGGLPVTTLERTVLDCARAMSTREALVIVDSALRVGVDRARVDAMVLAAAGARGVIRARRVWSWADAGAESPGESLTRHALLVAGLEPPALQVPVVTRLGIFRLDMGWPALRVAVEFDGLIKYGGAYGAPADVVIAEKRRQDAIEESGWIVVRVTWSDLREPVELAARLHRARAR